MREIESDRLLQSGMVKRTPWVGYCCAIVATAAGTAVGLLLVPRVDIVNVAMVYSLGVLLIALWFGQGPTLLTSMLSVAAFDVIFVPPLGHFSVNDLQYLLTFAIMAAIGLVVSRLRERIRGQEAARAELVSATETEKLRSTLLASISHDLRTPLAVLSGASSTLAEQGERMSAEERSELARSLYRQSSDLSDRVAKLLQMTRLQSGVIRAQCDWADLGEIAEAVVRRQRERFSSDHLLVELAEDLPLVSIDALLIEQALGNLVDNATRHTPDGTVVRLRVARRADEIVVSVEDNGHRLRDPAIEQAFLAFGDNPAKSRAGLGLGLSICRSIVDLHGGRAWGEYLPDGGVAFRFSIPVRNAPSLPPEPVAA